MTLWWQGRHLSSISCLPLPGVFPPCAEARWPPRAPAMEKAVCVDAVGDVMHTAYFPFVGVSGCLTQRTLAKPGGVFGSHGWDRRGKSRRWCCWYPVGGHQEYSQHPTMHRTEKCHCCSVTRSCPTLWNPRNCSPLGSSVHGISQARILEWVAISFSRGSSWSRDQTHVSCIGRQVVYPWVASEALQRIIWCKMPAQVEKPLVQFSSFQLLRHVQLFATPCTPGFSVHHQLGKPWSHIKKHFSQLKNHSTVSLVTCENR